MPELPEVEHARRQLQAWLLKRSVKSVTAGPSRVLGPSDRRALTRELPGRRLRAVERRGKWLLLTFEGGLLVLSHLGMTGKWQRVREGEPAPRHARAAIGVDGAVVYYTDPRLFGRIAVRPGGDAGREPALRDLGPDPLRDGLDPAAIHARLLRSSRPIKVALLDQSLFAGVGNILATEALFRARLSPMRICSSLSLPEVKKLVGGVDAAIAHGLAAEKGEGTITYVEEGGHNPFLIYGRAGEPCPHCGRTLLSRVIAGRTTAYCPHDQPDPRGARKKKPARKVAKPSRRASSRPR